MTSRVIQPKNRLLKQIYQQRWAYFFLLPTIVLLLVFHYFPLWGIQLAFKNFIVRKGISKSPYVGFVHFETLLKSKVFYRAFTNTLIISFYRLLFGLPCSVLFALLLNEIRNEKYKRFAQTVSYMPHFISWVILGGIIAELLSPSRGILNYIRSLFGMAPVHFLVEPKYFRGILVLTGIWKEVGWSAIIYLAAIAGIDTALYEAASIDGASRVKIIRHIIIPKLLPVMSIQFILQLGGIMNAGFDQVFNLYNPLVYVKGDIIDTYVYRIGLQEEMKYSLSTAVGLFKNVVGLVLVVSSNAIVRRLGEGEYRLW